MKGNVRLTTDHEEGQPPEQEGREQNGDEMQAGITAQRGAPNAAPARAIRDLLRGAQGDGILARPAGELVTCLSVLSSNTDCGDNNSAKRAGRTPVLIAINMLSSSRITAEGDDLATRTLTITSLPHK